MFVWGAYWQGGLLALYTTDALALKSVRASFTVTKEEQVSFDEIRIETTSKLVTLLRIKVNESVTTI